MSPDALILQDALLQADECISLQMWEEASSALECIPAELKTHPEVLVTRLDIMVGQKMWDKGLPVVHEMIELYPQHAELWHRLARVLAAAGNVEDARKAGERCMELDAETRSFVINDALLAGIW
ncbi:MAG TPA: tetratricopeptide repeat protein [Candidatus Saccharimonadia bacterium]|nr:tetratricopeptide repeat protein [Candidatus Saccharimonadia bacterium]